MRKIAKIETFKFITLTIPYMKKPLIFLLFIVTFFSIQISSTSSKEISLNRGENATISITVVNDRPYSLGCVVSYLGSLTVALPSPTPLKPYETKTIYFTVSVPENYTGDNPSFGYVIVSEKTEGIVSSAVLIPIKVIVLDAEARSGQVFLNLAEEIKSSLEKTMENESVVVFPPFSIRQISPQTYLFLTFPKTQQQTQPHIFFIILFFFLSSLALFFIFTEITKHHGKV